MKIAVCVKQTPDTEARVRVAPDGQGIDESGLTWIISPHDESAVEQALQLRQAHGGDVTVVALGPSRVERAIRDGLAMGADAGLRLACDAMPVDATVTAAALAKVLKSGGFDLVLTGEQSIDQSGSQVPQRLAVLLGWPCVTAAEHLEVSGDTVRVRRPLEHDEVAAWFTLPGVVGINRRIGEPRYPSFRNIMKAKRKKIAVTAVALGTPAMATVRLHAPRAKAPGRVQEFGSGIEQAVASFLAGTS